MKTEMGSNFTDMDSNVSVIGVRAQLANGTIACLQHKGINLIKSLLCRLHLQHRLVVFQKLPHARQHHQLGAFDIQFHQSTNTGKRKKIVKNPGFNLEAGLIGFLASMQLIRQHFSGPIYFDMHSLVLAVQPDGLRTLQPLPNAAQWMACADVIQMNEDELAMMAPDSMALAATALAQQVSALVVTLGARGVVYFTAPGFEQLGDLARRGAGTSVLGAIRTALVAAERADVKGSGGDPTGCGDVFGATLFSRLLAGDTFTNALHAAIKAAARNVTYRGARGLSHHLRGELIPS